MFAFWQCIRIAELRLWARSITGYLWLYAGAAIIKIDVTLPTFNGIAERPVSISLFGKLAGS